MTKYLLLIFLIIPFFAQTQVIKDSSLSQSKTIINKDTVVIIQQRIDNNIAQNYQQILEKTNSQLSLWWNPYGVFIAMLGVLFTVLAIVAAFVIYRQSKEYRDLIKNSLEEHKIALDKLINEKNNQLKIYDASLDKSIKEYTEQLKTVSKDSKEQIEKFITKLEEQKEYIDTQIHTYKHSGWGPKDIPENYPVDLNSNFYARIILNDIVQSFIIYIRVITGDNNQIWIGFAGNTGKTTPGKGRNEYTSHQTFNDKEVIINENIFNIFKQGFPELKTLPIRIINIRLRASNTDLREITFSYKII